MSKRESTRRFKGEFTLILALPTNRSAGLKPALHDGNAESRSQTGAPMARVRGAKSQTIQFLFKPMRQGTKSPLLPMTAAQFLRANCQ
jgi:hypothetical protein